MELVMRGWQLLADDVGASPIVLLLVRLTLIGAVGHVALVLMRRASAASRHLVATVTLALMMATPLLGLVSIAGAPVLRIPLPGSKDSVPSKWRASEIYENPATGAVRYSITPVGKAPPSIRTSDPTDVGSGSGDPWRDSPRPFAIPWHAWPAVFVLVAFVGASALLTLRLLTFVSTAWIARVARDVDDPRLLALFARSAASIGRTHPVAFKVTRHLHVPAVGCFGRPVLLLPVGALEWSEARLRAVILHELAHVQRRDAIGFAVGRAATALLWFHPLSWTLTRAAREECERACDDVVLLAGVRPSEYADHLLAIARGAARPERKAAMSLAFARPSTLEGRLLSILRADVRRAPISRGAAVLTTLALAALIVPMAAVTVVAEPGASKSDAQWPVAKTATASSFATSTSTTKTSTQLFSTSERSQSSWSSSGHDDDGASNDLGPAEARTGEQWYEEAKSEYDAQRYGVAGEAFERAARAGENVGKAWYNAACCWALDGQENRALGALHESMQSGFDVTGLMESDGDLNAVRSDRRFQMLLKAAQHETELASMKDKDTDDEADDDTYDADDPDQLRSTAIHLMRTGRATEAAQLFAKEYAIDSLATTLYNNACAWSIAGRTDRSLDMLERSLYAGYGDREKFENDDDLANVRRNGRFEQLCDVADDLELRFPKGKHNGEDAEQAAWEKLLPHYESVAKENPRAGRAWFNLGFAALRAGEPEEARQANLQALGVGYRRGATNYNLACSAAQLGDEKEALRRLEMAQDAGMDITSTAWSDDDLKALRNNPQFREMTRDGWHGGSKKNKSAKSKDKDDRTDG